MRDSRCRKERVHRDHVEDVVSVLSRQPILDSGVATAVGAGPFGLPVRDDKEHGGARKGSWKG